VRGSEIVKMCGSQSLRISRKMHQWVAVMTRMIGQDYRSIAGKTPSFGGVLACFTLVMTVTIAPVSPVFAEDEWGFYATGRIGGVYAPTHTLNEGNYPGTSSEIEGEFKTGYWVGGALGFNFLPHWRLEGELYHQNIPFDQITASGNTAMQDWAGEVSLLGGGLNAYYDIPLGLEGFFPYVGLGVGWSHLHADVDVNDQSMIDDYDSAMDWQGILGMGFRLDENWLMTLDYRYQQAQERSVRDTNNGQLDFELENHKVSLGLSIPLSGNMPTLFGRAAEPAIPAAVQSSSTPRTEDGAVAAQRASVSRSQNLMENRSSSRRDYDDTMRPQDQIIDPFAMREEMSTQMTGLLDHLTRLEMALSSLRNDVRSDYGQAPSAARGQFSDLMSQMDALKRKMDNLDSNGEMRPRLSKLEQNALELGVAISGKETDVALAGIHKQLKEIDTQIETLEVSPVDMAPERQAPIQSARPPRPAPVKRSFGSHLGVRVQLASFRSEQMAEEGWRKLIRRNGDLLSGLQRHILPIDLGAKGVYYRLYVTGFGNRQDASALCSRLQSRGDSCLLPKA